MGQSPKGEKDLKGQPFLNALKGPASSHVWRSLMWSKDLLAHGSRKLVFNGRSTSFWNDRWLGDQCLKELCNGPSSSFDDSKLVSDYVTENGGWDWENLRDIPDNVKEQLSMIHINHEVDDRVIWSASSNGLFSLSSAYKSLLQPSVDDNTLASCIDEALLVSFS